MLLLPVISSTQNTFVSKLVISYQFGFLKVLASFGVYSMESANFSLGGQTKVETPKIEV